MNFRFLATVALFTVATPLLFVPPVTAQETVAITGEDRPLDATFEEVFRVGVVEGESWRMLGTVRNVAFDARGNLYLFDGFGGVTGPWQDPRVLVFDADGAFVREFGKSGEGPGEFKSAMAMAVFRDGRTVVSDFGHRGYQIFDESGALQRMVRVDNAALPLLFAGEIEPTPGPASVCIRCGRAKAP